MSQCMSCFAQHHAPLCRAVLVYTVHAPHAINRVKVTATPAAVPPLLGDRRPVPAAVVDGAWCALRVQVSGAAGAADVPAIQKGHPTGFVVDKAIELCLRICRVVKGAVPDCVVLGILGSLEADLDI